MAKLRRSILELRYATHRIYNGEFTIFRSTLTQWDETMEQLKCLRLLGRDGLYTPAHLDLPVIYQKTYWTGIHRLIFLWQGGKWQALVSFWGSFRCRQPRFKNLSSHLKNLIWIPCFPQVTVHWLQEDHSNSRRVKILLIFNLEIAARSVGLKQINRNP